MNAKINWDQFGPSEIPDAFWELIALAKRDRAAYRSKLEGMNRGGLVRTAWLFRETAALLKSRPYLAHLDPTITEDSLDDHAKWIVAQGKETFMTIFDHPETIPKTIDETDGTMGMLSDVVNEYRKRYDEPIPARL